MLLACFFQIYSSKRPGLIYIHSVLCEFEYKITVIDLFRPKIAILDQISEPELKFFKFKIEFAAKNMYLDRFWNKQTSFEHNI